MNSRQPTDPDNLELPKSLADELATLGRSSITLPPELDRAILAEAKLHLTNRSPRRMVLRWSATAAGLAAAILVAIRIMGPGTTITAPAQASIAQDVNGDGRVDILDALALAQKVEHHSPLDKRWDVNHDGAIDRRDADQIADNIVSLKGVAQ